MEFGETQEVNQKSMEKKQGHKHNYVYETPRF